jgi:hypothetical protein
MIGSPIDRSVWTMNREAEMGPVELSVVEKRRATSRRRCGFGSSGIT